MTSSATRTGAPAAAASARPYSALTVTGRVPVAVASPTRAVTVSQRSSGTSSLAGSMSTALTAVPAVRSSRAAVSSRPLATSASAAGWLSRLSSSFWPPNPQPQRHRPVAPILGRHCVGQHDETLDQPPVGHVTPVRGPCRPVVAQRMNDADSRHGGPPADGEAAIRLTLVSVRRPATGYPPAAWPGQELLITMAPLPGTPDRSGVTGAVVAAVHDDRGLRDAGQLTGQVEAPLAGEDCRRVVTACLV